MAWYWNPNGVSGLAAGLVAWTLAAVVLFTAPGLSRNRRLAFILFLEGTTAFFGGGLVIFRDDAATVHAAQAVGFLAFGVMILAYPYFLLTLPSPLIRPLRRPWVEWGLVAAMVAFAVWFLVRTDLFISGVGPTPFARLVGVGGPLLGPVLILPSLPVFFFGVLVAVTMWLSAPKGSGARRQGVIYAAAFAIRDAAWGAFLLTAFLGPSYTFGQFGPQVFNLVLIVVYGTLAYGILRYQLFDIDLRLKAGLGRSLVIAVVAGTFFVASEAAEAWLDIDGWLLGLVAAGVIALAAVPLHRLAMRAVDRLLPGIQRTPEYQRRRKEEVYGAAFHELGRDGRLSEQDRARLLDLRRRLGLADVEAV